MIEAELKALAERLTELEAVVGRLLDRFERLRPPHVAVPERDIAAEIARHLGDHPASTSTEIGLGIHVHRDRVSRVLATDGRFERVAAPPGRSRRAKCWGLTPEPVRQVGAGLCGDERGSA